MRKNREVGTEKGKEDKVSWEEGEAEDNQVKWIQLWEQDEGEEEVEKIYSCGERRRRRWRRHRCRERM